jgi:hypothetical protein
LALAFGAFGFMPNLLALPSVLIAPLLLQSLRQQTCDP